MVMQVTVNIRQETYREAERIARETGQRIEDVIATFIDSHAPSPTIDDLLPVESLDDAALLALAERTMDAEQQSSLSALLEAQQARDLTEAEQAQLESLLQRYDVGSIRKAQALVELKRRGLRT